MKLLPNNTPNKGLGESLVVIMPVGRKHEYYYLGVVNLID